MRLLLFLSLLAATARCEVFSSAADMREVFNLENDLVDILTGYAAKLDSKLMRIKSYIKVRSRNTQNGLSVKRFLENE